MSARTKVIAVAVSSLLWITACDITDSKEEQTTQDFRSISTAIQLMYLDIGRYPTSDEGLSLIVSAGEAVTGWKGPYIEGNELLNDVWGNRIEYELQPDSLCYILRSRGDGVIEPIVTEPICRD